uniref:Uncharacterized protein n=1 Tax=Callorhinchus milii TaxID=7868 RepID=A0A4W3J9D5_CALMI
LLEYVKAGGDVQVVDLVGQVGELQRQKDNQDEHPHAQADPQSKPLPPRVSAHQVHHTQVALHADTRHGHDRAIHVGIEDTLSRPTPHSNCVRCSECVFEDDIGFAHIRVPQTAMKMIDQFYLRHCWPGHWEKLPSFFE